MSCSEDGQLQSPMDEDILRKLYLDNSKHTNEKASLKVNKLNEWLNGTLNSARDIVISLHLNTTTKIIEYGAIALPNADDADSLDIKPPQANFIKDTNGSKRKEKSNKDKKHSKERKHKERYSESSVILRQREKNYQQYQAGRVERRSDGDRRDLRRDDRYQHHIQQRQGGGGNSGHDDRGDDRAEYDKRYQSKHYDRRGSHISANTGGISGNYHHNESYHHQSYQQLHQHQNNTHYYDRRQDYHQQPADYHITHHHNSQQQQRQSYTSGGTNKHHQDMEVERRSSTNKYSYDNQKDPESLEQDLRSRLLSKRHKYVREDTAEYYDRNVRSYDEHEKQNQYQRSTSNNDHHKTRREKLSKEVIEVFDSPEGRRHHSQRKKHKRRREKHDKKASSIENDIVMTCLDPFEKSRSTEDFELVAHRIKLLDAEQEKQKRKDIARNELEARCEILKERKGDAAGISMGTLSPSAVAASVTAGLHIIKRKTKSDENDFRRKRLNRGSSYNEDIISEDDGDDDNEIHDEDDNRSGSTSTDNNEKRASVPSKRSASNRNYQKSSSVKLRKYKRERGVSNDDGEISLPNSPLSIGELSKSPKQRKHRSKQMKRSRKMHQIGGHGKNVDKKLSYSRSGSRSRSIFTLSLSRSRSRSFAHKSERSRSKSSNSRDSSTSLSRSYSKSQSLSSEHHQSRSPNVNSKSRSHLRSRYSRSCSKSSSRSRSRSEERNMHESFCKEQNEKRNIRNEIKKIETEKPILDSKGKQLPNYYPGIQGCRSVEEFQCLNRIDEGTYGVVYRAKDKRTEEIVALKRLKMEKEKEGFPITSLREINTLLKGQHPNIVTVREIVVGSNMDKIYIVMDYVEHDLKSLMDTMKARKQSFLPAEIKCLTQQLLKAVGHLHDNWILHRDLKTSNLLLSHKGILKVGDFGLAREYGSPLKQYTSVVVTLYYRAPELLLCSPEYSTPIDIWSVGCIFGEFLQMAPMFPGKSEVDQLNRFFKVLGTPNEKIWPGYNSLPVVKNMVSQNSQFSEYPVSSLRKYFGERTTENGIAFLQGLLTYDPKQRLTAELALKHEYFQELPLSIEPSMFPTWPAKSELGVRRALATSPKPPPGGGHAKQLAKDELVAGSGGGKIISGIITGNKKTSANTGFVLNAGIDQRHVAMGPGFKLKF